MKFFVVLVGTLIYCNKAVPHPVLTEDFYSLDRSEQLLTCKNCHEAIYENLIKGPHYNAYNSYLKHLDYVEKSENLVEYQNHINQVGDNCVGCHSPANLFGTVFPLEDDSV